MFDDDYKWCSVKRNFRNERKLVETQTSSHPWLTGFLENFFGLKHRLKSMIAFQITRIWDSRFWIFWPVIGLSRNILKIFHQSCEILARKSSPKVFNFFCSSLSPSTDLSLIISSTANISLFHLFELTNWSFEHQEIDYGNAAKTSSIFFDCSKKHEIFLPFNLPFIWCL